MKPFVAVIGGRKAGKSTVIQALTGCRNRGYRGVVTDRVTNRSIYVVAGSPQEAGLKSEDLKRILGTAANDGSIIGLVMAVQPSVPKKRLSMERIFQEVQATGEFATFAVVLDPPYEDSNKKTSVSSSLPAIRRRLKALGLKPHRFDGRRFAHISAAAIRQLVGIP